MNDDMDRILEKINTLLAGDGGRVTLIEASSESVTLRFDPAGAANCERCAIDPDTVEMLVREAISSQTKEIKNIQVVTFQEEKT